MSKRISLYIIIVVIMLIFAGCSLTSGKSEKNNYDIIQPVSFEENDGTASISVDLDYKQFSGEKPFTFVLTCELRNGDSTADVVLKKESSSSCAESTSEKFDLSLADVDENNYTIILKISKEGRGKAVDTAIIPVKDHMVQLEEKTAKLIVSQLTIEEKVNLVTGQRASGDQRTDASGYTYPIERFGVPSIIMADGPSGVRLSNTTISYPSETNIASTWNRSLAKKIGAAIGSDALANNINVVLGPGVCIQRDPLCGRNFEYFSEDPILSGYMAASYINGMEQNGIIPCIKHFAANNQETCRAVTSSNVTERALREIYLPAFEIASKSAELYPISFMSAYNRINGIHCGTNFDLITGVLRDEWGFDGIVMTDWGAHGDKDALVNAGNDISMPGDEKDPLALLESYKKGKLQEKMLDSCCENILKFVFTATKALNENSGNTYDKEQNLAIARETAAESFVLLKNDAALPVRGEVSFYGERVNDMITNGLGSSNPNIEGRKSLYDVLLDSDVMEYRSGSSDYEFDAKKSEAAIYIITRSSQEGEDHADFEGDFRLSETELESIKSISKAFHAEEKKLIVLLNVGTPIETASFAPMADAIMFIGYPGMQGAEALIDVLTGAINPSGKLAETWPVSYESTPTYGRFPGNSDTTFYYEDIFVGYRFYETFDVEVSYPFGYGLTYTTFEYKNIKIKPKATETSPYTFTAEVQVKNTGSTKGKEIVQLYVKKPGIGAEQPKLVLAGFAKTKEIASGRSDTVSINFNEYALRYYDVQDSAWVIDPGTYEIYAAASVKDIRLVSTITIDKKIILQDVENRLGTGSVDSVLTIAKGFEKIVPETRENIALGKKVSVSSVESNLVGKNALDGNPKTRWSALGACNSPVYFFEVDLGESYDIDEIYIRWEAQQNDYKLFIKNSADEEWSEIASVKSTETKGNDSFKLDGKKARYIRMESKKGGYCSIFEFEVFQKNN